MLSSQTAQSDCSLPAAGGPVGHCILGRRVGRCWPVRGLSHGWSRGMSVCGGCAVRSGRRALPAAGGPAPQWRLAHHHGRFPAQPAVADGPRCGRDASRRSPAGAGRAGSCRRLESRWLFSTVQVRPGGFACPGHGSDGQAGSARWRSLGACAAWPGRRLVCRLALRAGTVARGWLVTKLVTVRSERW